MWLRHFLQGSLYRQALPHLISFISRNRIQLVYINNRVHSKICSACFKRLGCTHSSVLPSRPVPTPPDPAPPSAKYSEYIHQRVEPPREPLHPLIHSTRGEPTRFTPALWPLPLPFHTYSPSQFSAPPSLYILTYTTPEVAPSHTPRTPSSLPKTLPLFQPSQTSPHPYNNSINITHQSLTTRGLYLTIRTRDFL
jgi:hypothetical protein